MKDDDYAVEIRGLTKRYPGLTALDNIDFAVKLGETHVLVGENGAGKTTLLKILCGAVKPDSVEKFVIEGEAGEFSSPTDALRKGIAAIQQHFSLVPEMTVAENIFLGREMPGRLKTVDRRTMQKRAAELLLDMGIDLDPRMEVSRLDVSHQQIVEICKALSQNPRLLLMDEPTSGLTREETKRLFEVLSRLRERRVTVLYISHRLEEVFEVGDRVTVLYNGRNVHEGNLSDMTHAELVRKIVGREIGRRYPKKELEMGAQRLSVEGLCNTATQPPLDNISFEVRASEVVAIFGILGCGKDELADTLFGRTPATAGTIRVDEKAVQISAPSDAIRQRLGYLTEERHADGLVELMSLRSNLSLPSLRRRFSRFGRLKERDEREIARQYVKQLSLHVPTVEALVRDLSGGNQQKVVFGKWLLAEARTLILNEPTKGIDVGSKVQMYEIMTEEARKGAAVLLLTAEAEEAAELGDRVLVMRHGRIVQEFSRQDYVDGKVGIDDMLRIATKKES